MFYVSLILRAGGAIEQAGPAFAVSKQPARTQSSSIPMRGKSLPNPRKYRVLFRDYPQGNQRKVTGLTGNRQE
jgi:hypothetical protein